MNDMRPVNKVMKAPPSTKKQVVDVGFARKALVQRPWKRHDRARSAT